MSLLDFFGVTEPVHSLAPSPSDDFWYEHIARQTASGMRVDEHTAFNYSVCWAATRLLAGTSGWLPFNLHKRKPGGGAEIDSKHRVHRLIHDQPNNDMGAMMFRCQGVNHQVNWGNTYSEILRNGGGGPAALEPIHPRRIPPQNIRRGDDGRLLYLVNRPNGVGQPQKVKQEDMFHVPSIISEDGIIGKGVVTAARESIGKAMGTQTRGASALKQGGAPPLALKNGKFKTKEDREDFRRQLNEVHGGPENAGKWLLLPTDAEVQMLGFSLKDSEFIESQQFDIEEICRWYGVPPHLVGHLLRATFNNIEELGIAFVKYSLILWLKLWEQEVWRKLLTPAEQETHYAKFNVDALERGNLANRTEAGVKKFFNGLWTLNDWAQQEDMNPIEETAVIDGKTVSLGDMHFVQQAMIPLVNAAKGPDQAVQVEGESNLSATDEAKQKMEAYGIGVRAGAITPQLDDEDAFRQDTGLPPMGEEAKKAWADDKGIRRPITLRDPNAPTTPFGQPQRPPTEESEPKDDDLSNKLSRIESLLTTMQQPSRGLNGEAQELREQLAATKAAQAQLAGALLRDVRARLLSMEINAVKRVAEKPSRFDVRLREFYDKHAQTMRRELAAPMSACYNGEGAARLESTVAGHIAESLSLILGVCECQADELSAKVDELVSKWYEERITGEAICQP